MRRTWKSTLPRMYADELRESCVGDGDIVWLNLKFAEHMDVCDYISLLDTMLSMIGESGMKYVFIDEI